MNVLLSHQNCQNVDDHDDDDGKLKWAMSKKLHNLSSLRRDYK